MIVTTEIAGMIWLTADTHFGHAGVVEMLNRPFTNLAAMDEGLIEIWNSLVKPRDTVWHLGDFSLGPKGTAERYFRKLHGSIHLVRGNHDGTDVLRCRWASVHDLASQRVDGVRLVLSHYPMLSWPGSSYNQDGVLRSLMAHGHVHGKPGDPRVPHIDPCRWDVGVDMWSMAPVAAETLVARCRAAMSATKD